MHAHHILRTAGEGGDFVHVQRGGVGSQNRAGLHHLVQLFKDSLFHAQVFKHGFDDQIRILQVCILQRRAQQGHALLVLVLLELAFFDLCFVVLANHAHATV